MTLSRLAAVSRQPSAPSPSTLHRHSPFAPCFMAKDLYCFCFKPSQAQNADCSIATNLPDFRGARKGFKGRPATDVRIFFDEAMTRRFVNPLWLSDVSKAVKESSYGGSKVRGNTNALTCTTTWTFSGAEDPDLRRFDDFYQVWGESVCVWKV